MADLRGKTAIVTGAGRGIGFGIAKILSQHGASVMVLTWMKQAQRKRRKKFGQWAEMRITLEQMFPKEKMHRKW